MAMAHTQLIKFGACSQLLSGDQVRKCIGNINTNDNGGGKKEYYTGGDSQLISAGAVLDIKRPLQLEMCRALPCVAIYAEIARHQHRFSWQILAVTWSHF